MNIEEEKEMIGFRRYVRHSKLARRKVEKITDVDETRISTFRMNVEKIKNNFEISKRNEMRTQHRIIFAPQQYLFTECGTS